MAENHRRAAGRLRPRLRASTACDQLSQVHGADVAVVGPDGPAARRPRPPARRRRRARHHPARRAPDGPRRRLRAGAAGPTRQAGWSAPPTAGRPGLVAGIVPATVAAMRDLGATDRADRLDRAARVRRLLRGARADAGRRRRGRAREPVHHLVGHAGARRRRRGPRPARARRGRGRRPRRRAPASRPISSPTAATASRSGRQAGIIRIAPVSADPQPRRDQIAAGLDAVRRPDRRGRRARAGATPTR